MVTSVASMIGRVKTEYGGVNKIGLEGGEKCVASLGQ